MDRPWWLKARILFRKRRSSRKLFLGKGGIGWLPSISPNGNLSTECMILLPLKSLIDFGGLLDI